jgi:hypothetical protein
MADDPAALASKWLACPSGRAGCRKLDTTTWTKNYGRTIDFPQADPVRLVNGVAYWKMRRFFPPKDPAKGPYVAFVDVIEPLDGAPLLAVGAAPFPWKNEERWCYVEALFGDYGIGFHARPRDPAIPLSQLGSDEVVLGSAPWTTPKTLATKAWSPAMVGAPGAYFIGSTMGERGFWLGGNGPLTMFLFDVVTQTGVITSDRFLSEHPIAVPGGALAFHLDTAGIDFVKNDGSHVALVRPAAAQALSWMTLDRGAGSDLVWVETGDDGLGTTSSTLWTAPLATTLGEIVRRPVAKLNVGIPRGGARAPANKGVFLNVIGRTTALLTRLQDGMGWLIEAEPQQVFLDPIWVDDNDVFILTGVEMGTSYSAPSSVVRISRATLGAPTVASGL